MANMHHPFRLQRVNLPLPTLLSVKKLFITKHMSREKSNRGPDEASEVRRAQSDKTFFVLDSILQIKFLTSLVRGS